MASNPLTFTLTPGMAPVAPMMRMLGRYDRKKVEAFAEISIALLDLWDGDSEAEDDDPAGQCDEDEINTGSMLAAGRGPGCEVADTCEEDDHSGCEHDGREPDDDGL